MMDAACVHGGWTAVTSIVRSTISSCRLVDGVRLCYGPSWLLIVRLGSWTDLTT